MRLPAQNVSGPGWDTWARDAEGAALFHAPEDEMDAKRLAFPHAARRRGDTVLLAHALFHPLDGDAMIAGVGLHSIAAVVAALAECLFAHHRQVLGLPEEVHHLLGPRQAAEVTVTDHAVEAVVCKEQQAAKPLGERLQRSSPLASP